MYLPTESLFRDTAEEEGVAEETSATTTTTGTSRTEAASERRRYESTVRTSGGLGRSNAMRRRNPLVATLLDLAR
eukprot:Awhi_evm1s12317